MSWQSSPSIIVRPSSRILESPFKADTQAGNTTNRRRNDSKPQKIAVYGNAAKRQKVEGASEVIWLSSDDNDEGEESKTPQSNLLPKLEENNALTMDTNHQVTRTEPARPIDHNGFPLSDEALRQAKLYWDCQREYDLCPFGLMHVEGPEPEQHPLNRMAASRRRYTELVLGIETLEPGMRTYEPPYIPPPSLIDLTAGQSKTAATAAPENPPKPVKPILSPEQAEVVNLAVSGRNVFYTGSAGCGKSTILHEIRSRLSGTGRVVKVMAPTGIVALAINGDTTWRFAGWNPTLLKRPLAKLLASSGKHTIKRLQRTDVIIIDEISMVENHHFERLNLLLQKVRIDKRPFGGLQVIVTGDFCQLPPVRPFSNCMYCGKDFRRRVDGDEPTYTCPECNRIYTESDKWAFRSDAWTACDFAHVHLKGVHRQNDEKFISMLQKCRLGTPFHPNETDLLMNHDSTPANAITLFSTRAEVTQENNKRFASLNTPPYPYKCYDSFEWNQEDEQIRITDTKLSADEHSLQSLSDHRFSAQLVLKVGMPVVLLANIDIAQGLCNGSQGIIARFEPYDPDKLPKQATNGGNGSGGSSDPYETLQGDHALLRELHIRRFCDSQKEGLHFPVVRWLRNMAHMTVVHPECQVTERGEVSRDGKTFSLLSRTQVPLAPAWAISIHKSQGMTLDRVIVDLSRAFEEGQVYVALSRATSLKGLTVRGNPEGLAVGAGGNREVRRFLRERFGI